MRGFIPWAAIVVLAFLLWDARKALGRGGHGILPWSLARLLTLWAAYALVVWSTSNVQSGSGALLLLWVILLLPCAYVTWRWFRSESD
jgi:hypothetical protein